MWMLLQIVGGLWALLGLANLVMMPWGNGSSGITTFGLIFNMVLFVLPGLVVFGLGGVMKRKAAS